MSAVVAETLRTCRTCGIAKRSTDFRAQVKNGKTYHRSNCRECDNAKNRDWCKERANRPIVAELQAAGLSTQTCRVCKRELPLSEFRLLPAMRLGVDRRCKGCESAYSREWNVKNPDRYTDSHLRRNFGITLDDYTEMLACQGGVCAICGEMPTGPRNQRRGGQNVFKARLVVDHDHATGKVRGLLCSLCNTGIGGLNDDAALLRAALAYLERREVTSHRR